MDILTIRQKTLLFLTACQAFIVKNKTTVYTKFSVEVSLILAINTEHKAIIFLIYSDQTACTYGCLEPIYFEDIISRHNRNVY